MTCSSCSAALERALKKTAGISSVAVNLVTNTATVEADPHSIKLSEILEIIRNTGYQGRLHEETQETEVKKDYELSLIHILFPYTKKNADKYTRYPYGVCQHSFFFRCCCKLSAVFILNGAYYVLILSSLHIAVSVYLHQLTKFIQRLRKEGKGIVIHAVLSWIHTCMNQLL